MFWLGVYFLLAAMATVGIFVAACWFREDHIAAPEHPGVVSILAGLLWPVLLVGLAELAVVYLTGRDAGLAPEPEALSVA